MNTSQAKVLCVITKANLLYIILSIKYLARHKFKQYVDYFLKRP